MEILQSDIEKEKEVIVKLRKEVKEDTEQISYQKRGKYIKRCIKIYSSNN